MYQFWVLDHLFCPTAPEVYFHANIAQGSLLHYYNALISAEAGHSS